MIEFGPIKIDSQILEKQLRQDLRDDWFPDPIKFRDFFGTGRIANAASQNFKDNHGEYLASKRVVANIPKSDFTLRAALETGIVDRAIYHGVSAYLCNHFDPLIPWYVFSHRRAKPDQSKKYLFRRGVNAWQDFQGAVRAQLKPGAFLLSTDLTTYFDNINIDKLEETMRGSISEIAVDPNTKSVIRSHVDFLFKSLKEWTYEGHRGLPQNRDASSFLANMYMRCVDIAMYAKGFSYVRYMDDIKIVCETHLEARRALKELVIELRKIGLSVNSKKTEIVAIRSEEDIQRCIEDSSTEVRHLEALWKTRKLSFIKTSFASLKELAIKNLQEGKLSSREFRFSINRLILLAGCHEIEVPDVYFDDITDLIIDAIFEQPTPTDKYVSYLEWVPLSTAQLTRIIDFIVDEERNMYEWQAFRLWCLMGSREVDDTRLIQKAEATLGQPDGPARAGSTYYLGAFGDAGQKQRIAEKFSELSTFLGQRAALVALQDVKFRPCIEDNVAAYVRTDLFGIYRNASKTKVGYFSKPEPVSLTQIVSADPHSA